MTARTAKGQTTVEFSFVAFAFILMLLAVFRFGFATFQKTSFDYQVSHMADELPDKWDSMSSKELTKAVIAKAAGISESDIHVIDSSVTYERDGETVLDDPTAEKLGSVLKTDTSNYFSVKAKVKVKLGSGLIGKDGISYTRKIDQTFTIERRWEVS